MIETETYTSLFGVLLLWAFMMAVLFFLISDDNYYDKDGK